MDVERGLKAFGQVQIDLISKHPHLGATMRQGLTLASRFSDRAVTFSIAASNFS